MRRIHASLLVLGIAALCGIGLLHGDPAIAQPEPPLDPVASTNYSFSKKDAAKASPTLAPPEPIELPSVPALAPEPTTGAAQPPLEPLRVPNNEVKPEPRTAPSTGEPPLVLPDMGNKPKAEPKPLPIEPIATPKFRETETSPRFESPRGTQPLPMSGGPGPVGNRIVPCVSLETIGADSTGHGKPVTYEIIVKNLGQATVTHVRVEEELPKDAKFMAAEPEAEHSNGKFAWMLGSIAAGEEKHIKVTVKPGLEGDLRTMPMLTYSVATQMVVKITRPSLAVTMTGPSTAQVGDDVPLQVQVTNNGSGDATEVVLKALLTDGLKHPGGKDVEAILPRLAAGETKTITLKAQAAATGPHTCSLTAMCDGAAKVTGKSTIQINQAKLALAMTGPTKCMVRSEPVFTLEIGNPGTSATQAVQMAAALPPEGLEFLSASDGGTYDPATRTVSWNLGIADAGTRRNLTIKTRAASAGSFALRAIAQAGPKLSARSEAVIAAEGVPALSFEVVNLDNPIEVGKETTYEIRIVNTGTCPCTNVRVTAITSEGLIPATATGPVPYKAVGQALHFDPIPKLGMKADAVIKLKAKGTTAGDMRFKVQISCDQLKQPMMKEESTSFYMQ